MSFLGEIKRRKAFQIAAVYLVVAWLAIQVVDVVNDPLSLPDWFDTVVILLLAIGFPITLIVSWAFDLTAHGVVRDQGDSGSANNRGKSLEYALITLLAIAVGWLLYRVEMAPQTQRPASSGGETQQEKLPNSIAVLLCENLSPDPDNAYFAVSLHHELLNRLVKLDALQVIDRRSVLQYENAAKPITEIADELNVESVMECSVSYAEGRVAISAQLIDGESGVNLWSNRYNRDFQDVFGIQADIAINIANQLAAEFSSDEQLGVSEPPTSSAEAYRLFLRALQVYQLQDTTHEFDVAHRYLDQAVALDPQFALAYAWKAYLYSDTLYFGGSARLSRDRLESGALENAAKALDLDDGIGLAHAARAGVNEVNWRWSEALDAYETALRLSPNDTDVITRYAYFNRAIGEYSESVRLMQRVRELSPADDGGLGQLAVSHMIAKNYDEALEAAEGLMRVNPNPITPITMANCLSAQDRFGEAVELLQQSEEFGEPTVNVAAWLVLGYANAGRPEDARRFFQYLEATSEPVSAAHWAMAYLGQGDEENTYRWLQQAIDERALADLIPLIELKSNLWGHPMLDKPEFQELRNRIGRLE